MKDLILYEGPLVILLVVAAVVIIRSKKKKSDPKKPSPIEPSEPSTPGTVTPTKIDHSKVKVLVESSAPRMMSAIYHYGLLGFGTYRDNSQNHVIWEDGRKVAVGGRSEAVYRMSSIDGLPIANLEKDPSVYDARTGARLSTQPFDMVTDTIRLPDGRFASVGATQFKGDIFYRVHGDKPITLARGHWYTRGAFYKWGRDHTCAFNYDTEHGGLHVSVGDQYHDWKPIFADGNFRPMHVAEFGNKMAIAFSKYKDGKRQGGGLLFLNEDLSYSVDKFINEPGGCFDVVTDGENIYCSFLNWKGSNPGAIWWRDKNGKWTKIYQTDGPGEVLGLALTAYGTLAAAIREHGKAKGIEIGDRSNKPKPETIDEQSRPFPAGWIWKPHSEGTGTLVVLASGIVSGYKLSIVDRDGNQAGRVIRERIWEHKKSSWYFDKHGKDYPKPCYLVVNGEYFKIEDGSKRLG